MSPAGVLARLEVAIRQKAYSAATGGTLRVIEGLTFSLGKGEVGALVGPSGCGKTTLLRIIAGLDADYEGEVHLPDHGRLGMVFQEPRLLPWRTVEQNVRLAVPQVTDDELTSLFAALGLAAHRQHYPGELSLGLARRVALARAFAVNPDLLLLDEPFDGLDAEGADLLHQELAERIGCTALVATHDPESLAARATARLALA
jgi:NitT/TauT family transport system ATP-binding protein